MRAVAGKVAAEGAPHETSCRSPTCFTLSHHCHVHGRQFSICRRLSIPREWVPLHAATVSSKKTSLVTLNSVRQLQNLSSYISRRQNNFLSLIGNRASNTSPSDWEIRNSECVSWEESSEVTKIPLAESRRLIVMESKLSERMERKDRKKMVKCGER